MPVKVVHEKEFGMSVPNCLERCCKCRKPTPYWYPKKPRDCALCPDCATNIRKVSEIPLKKDWCRFEDELAHIRGRMSKDIHNQQRVVNLDELVEIERYYGGDGVRLAVEAIGKDMVEAICKDIVAAVIRTANAKRVIR